MPQKFIVRAPDRKNAGHPGTYRGGRFFPGGEDKTIEVLDQDECPTLEERSGNQTRRFLDPDRVGRKAWELIAKDDTLSKRPFGTPVHVDPSKPSEADALKAKIAELESSNAALLAKVAELEAKNAELAAEVDELKTIVDGTQEIADANRANLAKIDELTATLESLTAPAAKSEDLPKSKSKSAK